MLLPTDEERCQDRKWKILLHFWQIKGFSYLMSSMSEAEHCHYACWLELEIVYFRFRLHQRPYVLLYSKSLVFCINNPAFSWTYNYCCLFLCLTIAWQINIHRCDIYYILYKSRFTWSTFWHQSWQWQAIIQWNPFICIYSNELALLPSNPFSFFFLFSGPVTSCWLHIKLDLLR